MQQSLGDVFSETIAKVKQLGMWEKLTDSQKETLISRNIREYYIKKCVQQKANPSGKL